MTGQFEGRHQGLGSEKRLRCVQRCRFSALASANNGYLPKDRFFAPWNAAFQVDFTRMFGFSG